MAIDANLGSNDVVLELYAWLAELDETKVPMAYLFVEKVPSNENAPNRGLTQVLDCFFMRPP